MLEAGEMVGKYEIIRPLGAGGEGCVYLAKDSTLCRLAAVKQVGIGAGGLGEVERAERERYGEETEREILQEAVFLRDLRHPMLPVVYDLLYVDGWYLIMEYIAGISLHNYIKKKGGVEEKQGRIWAEALLFVLEYLHNRRPPVIYRDLKPDNIIVCPDRQLRLVDFGAACQKKYEKGTKAWMALTPGYGAPEQQAVAGGMTYADERSDIYAFGKVLSYILTGADLGRPPYGSLPVSVYNPLLGESLERVIQKCIREDPDMRYQTAEEIRRDLFEQNRKKRGIRLQKVCTAYGKKHMAYGKTICRTFIKKPMHR